jgi:two-component system sensor histidine kinase HydH
MRAPALRSYSVVVAVALMAAALLVTTWSTYAAVRSASLTLVRGQAGAYEQAVRWELRRTEGEPTAADLASLLEELSPSGLRHVALVSRRGVEVEAGTSTEPLPLPERLPPGEPVFRGDRVLVLLPARPRRDRGPAGGVVLLEFEPLEARSLRAAAIRTVGIGTLTGTMLLVVAMWLVRAVLRREAVERELERDRRLSSLGEMSAVLAHEIRNPLASLKGNAQLLAESLRGDDRAAKATRVVDEAQRLEQLTGDLLAYARGGGRERTPTDPTALLRACAAEVDPAIRVDGEAPPSFAVDEPRMRQLLVNLLQNAVQAGPPVEATVRGSARELIVEVRDHGPGVPAADRSRIFEPFHTGRTRGTGLGLAVVRRVVEEHAGTIAVEDAPGGGAVFRVTLPAGGGPG